MTTLHSPLISLIGPTASGKTRLGVALASAFNGEIISADSRQVYRGMDIGTGKDLDEYGAVPYHLINIANPGHEYNLFEFATDFCIHFEKIRKRQALPFLVGGTALYLDAVFNRYQLAVADPETSTLLPLDNKTNTELINLLYTLNPAQHNTTDTLDRKRLVRAIEIAQASKDNQPTLTWPEFKPLILGIAISREETRRRITLRLKQRLKEGMIEEVEQLHQQGLSWDQLDFYGLEYRFVANYLKGELNYNDMVQKLNSAIHRFAKQQEKWFRKMRRNGLQIIWLNHDDHLFDNAKLKVETFLNSNPAFS